MSGERESKVQMKNFGTPYDDVYRTLQNDCRKWIIPIVNEAFGEHYTGEEQIIPATRFLSLSFKIIPWKKFFIKDCCFLFPFISSAMKKNFKG